MPMPIPNPWVVNESKVLTTFELDLQIIEEFLFTCWYEITKAQLFSYTYEAINLHQTWKLAEKNLVA